MNRFCCEYSFLDEIVDFQALLGREIFEFSIITGPIFIPPAGCPPPLILAQCHVGFQLDEVLTDLLGEVIPCINNPPNRFCQRTRAEETSTNDAYNS